VLAPRPQGRRATAEERSPRSWGEREHGRSPGKKIGNLAALAFERGRRGSSLNKTNQKKKKNQKQASQQNRRERTSCPVQEIRETRVKKPTESLRRRREKGRQSAKKELLIREMHERN